MRFAGILLSGKQPGPPVLTLHANPVRFGSLIQRIWPALLTVCEKSPARSSAVGMGARVRGGILVGHAVVGEVERRLAVDRHAADRSPARGVARGGVDDTGQHLEAAHEVAALQADVLDLAGGDRRGTLAARGVDL